jgi:hypothetical protein
MKSCERILVSLVHADNGIDKQTAIRLRKKLADEFKAQLTVGVPTDVEFKSSARWDMKQNKADKLIEGIVVKTVAALLNSEGGALLLGVDDERNVIGLAHDYKLFGKKDSRDAYENLLTGLLLNHLGKDSVSTYLDYISRAGRQRCLQSRSEEITETRLREGRQKRASLHPRRQLHALALNARGNRSL